MIVNTCGVRVDACTSTDVRSWTDDTNIDINKAEYGFEFWPDWNKSNNFIIYKISWIDNQKGGLCNFYILKYFAFRWTTAETALQTGTWKYWCPSVRVFACPITLVDTTPWTPLNELYSNFWDCLSVGQECRIWKNYKQRHLLRQLKEVVIPLCSKNQNWF